MKTYNLTKLVKGVVLAAALVTSVVACGNKDKNNNNQNAFQMSCTNCGDISGIPFFSVNSTVQSMSYYGSQTAMRLSLTFSGQNTQQQQGTGQTNYYYGAPASMMYTGKASAIGIAAISYPLSLGMCPQLPPGNWNIVTRNAGMWNGSGSQAQISGLRVELQKDGMNAVAVFTNVAAVEYPYSGYSSQTRLWGNMQIESVNGYWCQGANFQLY
jgi:hypothetical protein